MKYFDNHYSFGLRILIIAPSVLYCIVILFYEHIAYRLLFTLLSLKEERGENVIAQMYPFPRIIASSIWLLGKNDYEA